MNVSSLLGLVPSKYLVPAGILASVNKRVVIPAAKKVASKVTTSLGILTEQQAQKQEELFDEMLFPITKIIDNLEQQVISILGGNFSETLSSWIGGKKKHSPTEILEKEDQAVKENKSALGQNIGGTPDAVYIDKKKMETTGRGMMKPNPNPKKSQVSAQNIDMSLFNAMEHEQAHQSLTNPHPLPSTAGASGYSQPSLADIAKSMRTPGEGSLIIPKRKKL